MEEKQEIENREQVEMVNPSEERTTDGVSRTESETHLDEGQRRWRDERDGSLADDEDEDEDDGRSLSSAFTPLVNIVRKSSEKQSEGGDVRGGEVPGGDVRGGEVRGSEVPGGGVRGGGVRGGGVRGGDVRGGDVRGGDVRGGGVRGGDVRGGGVRGGDVRGGGVRGGDVRGGGVRGGDVSTRWKSTTPSRCVCCGEMMTTVLFLLAGVVMFPLLVWGGHDLLPIDLPAVRSAPSRLVYTLRCALFPTFPIILGVLVHGVSRLKFSSLNPLYEGEHVNRHTLVHMTFVQDSLRLFLLFFVQLAVMSTYIHHEALKLVPLLTIVFVFGRMIYWPSVCFSSSVRVLGFSLSFLPVLTLMGLNLYFIFSSTGEGAVFDVAPPTTPPPPKARGGWWG